MAMNVMKKYAGRAPISLLKSEYHGLAIHKERPSHIPEKSKQTKYFAFTDRYKLTSNKINILKFSIFYRAT